MSKRVLALILSPVTVLVMLASPAAAAKEKDFVTLMTDQPGALTAGTAAWLSLVWESNQNNLQHFSVVVDSVDAGVSIAYPSEGTETGLWQNHILAKNEVDFTAIYVAVPADFSG